MNYGFKPIEIQPEDYILGGTTKLTAEILQPDGNWDAYLPIKEFQERNGLETANCTNYGTLNVLETLHKKLYDKEENWSERYTGVMTGTTTQGNNVQTVIETIRKECGLVPEDVLPFDNTIKTWDKYYSPKPMSKEIVLLGKNWLLEYEVGHEWVFGRTDKNKANLLKNSLRYSPIGVSVLAWIKNDVTGLYTKPKGETDNHWVMCYGYSEPYNGVGGYFKIFDHYDNTFKKLTWNYDFGCAKRYTLTKKVITPQAKEEGLSNIQKVLNIIKAKIEYIRQEINKLKGKLWQK